MLENVYNVANGEMFMKTITIDKAFAAALFAACEKGGRGFQAAICQETGVDSANISAMKKGKVASEEVRISMFSAISSRLIGCVLQCKLNN